MDDESKALINAVVHEAAAPYRKAAEVVIGWAFLDELKEKREEKKLRRLKNRASIARDAFKIIDQRDVKVTPEEIAPEHVEKVMAAGEDTSIPELQQVFARLLAAAIDPARQRFFRPEFSDLAQKFAPLDALVLQMMGVPANNEENWARIISAYLGRTLDEVQVSGRNLEKLELLVTGPTAASVYTSANISPVGRQFLACIKD